MCVRIMQSRYRVKMDEGLCWVIVIGSFLSQFTAFGFHNVFGQLYVELLTEFGESKALTAWVGSSSYALTFMLGPLAGAACNKFGCSATAVIGGILFGLGLFLSAFVDSISKLYLTYSVLVAVGSSCVYYSSILVLRDYFSKSFALVNGIALSGVGIGTIALAPILDFLLVRFQWRMTLKIMSAMSFILVINGLLFRAVPRPSKPDTVVKKDCDKKLLDFSVFRNKAYLVWTAVLTLVLFGFYVPYVHLVRHCNDLEIPRHKAVVLVGYIAIAQSVGRVCFGRIADHPRVNRVKMFQFGLLACSVLTTFLPVMTSYSTLLAYCWLYGISDGCFGVLLAVLTGDIVGTKKFSSALAFLYCITAFSMMLGPIVAGWIYDLYETYDPSFFIAGAFNVTGVCLVFLIPSLLPPEIEKEWNSRLSTNRYGVRVSGSDLSCDSDTKTLILQSDSKSESAEGTSSKSEVVRLKELEESIDLIVKTQSNPLLRSMSNRDVFTSVSKRMSQYVLVPLNYSNSEPLWLPHTSLERETVL